MKRKSPLPKRKKPLARKTPLKRTKPLRHTPGKPTRFAGRRDDTDQAYGKWVRGRSCLLGASGRCYGPVEADHVKTRGSGGTDLGNLINLCTLHHTQRHTMGRHSFEKKYGVDLAQIAADLFAQYDRWGM